MVLLVKHNRPPPKVSKLEGDAVFSYWSSAGLIPSWLMDMTVTLEPVEQGTRVQMCAASRTGNGLFDRMQNWMMANLFANMIKKSIQTMLERIQQDVAGQQVLVSEPTPVSTDTLRAAVRQAGKP